MTTLLRGRWLYVGLCVLVVVLYGRFFLVSKSSLTASDALTRAATQEEAPASHRWSLELEPKEFLDALLRKPGAAPWLGIWTMLVLALGVSGVALNIQAVAARRYRRLFTYRSRLSHFWSLQELGRIVAILVSVAALLPFIHIAVLAWGPAPLAEPRLWSVLSMFVLESFLLLLVWGFATTKAVSLPRALGLSSARGWGDVRQGLRGYATLFPWVFGLLWLIATVCERLGVQPPVEPIQELLFMENQPLTVWLAIGLVCVVGPIAEEIFFRGVLFTAARKRTSRVVATLISSALFSAVHTNVVGFVPILLLGALLADLYERTGSLLSPIIVHMLHNTLLVGLALTFKTLFMDY